MSAVSNVAICNLALTRIGQRTIESLTEQSQQAQVCNANYELLRDMVLAEFPWRFAVKEATLAIVSGETSNQYSYIYQKPADMLRALYLSRDFTTNNNSTVGTQLMYYANGALPVEYQVAGDRILSDMNPAILRYIYRVTDPTTFSSLFTDALAWRIAAEVVMSITGNTNMAQFASQMYAQQARRAIAVESSQARLPREYGNSIIAARHGHLGNGLGGSYEAYPSGSGIVG